MLFVDELPTITAIALDKYIYGHTGVNIIEGANGRAQIVFCVAWIDEFGVNIGETAILGLVSNKIVSDALIYCEMLCCGLADRPTVKSMLDRQNARVIIESNRGNYCDGWFTLEDALKKFDPDETLINFIIEQLNK